MPHIVVIEDEPVLRMTFRHALEERGYEVSDAANGRQGIELCRAKPPDLVITDVIMPELSGAEAVEILGREFPGLPIIAMSGMEEALVHESNNNSGSAHYVLKPVGLPRLVALVQEMLEEGSTNQTV